MCVRIFDQLRYIITRRRCASCQKRGGIASFWCCTWRTGKWRVSSWLQSRKLCCTHPIYPSPSHRDCLGGSLPSSCHCPHSLVWVLLGLCRRSNWDIHHHHCNTTKTNPSHFKSGISVCIWEEFDWITFAKPNSWMNAHYYTLVEATIFTIAEGKGTFLA